jgi:hypothetical protein
VALITRISLRNDSTANWLVNNSVVLLRGEVGFEYPQDEPVRMKVGDGITPWSQLPYFGGGLGINAIDKNVLKLDQENKLTILGFQEAEIGMSPVKGSNGQIVWTKLEAAELDSKIESLAEIVNSKVDLVYSEVNGEQVPWTLLSPQDKQKLDAIEEKA